MFVSYAHADADVVYDEMRWLHDSGLPLWYDDGIHVGSNWRRVLAGALSGAAGVLFFRTERSATSDNCLREINFALEHGKQIFGVRLDDARDGDPRYPLRQPLRGAPAGWPTRRAPRPRESHACATGVAPGERFGEANLAAF